MFWFSVLRTSEFDDGSNAKILTVKKFEFKHFSRSKTGSWLLFCYNWWSFIFCYKVHFFLFQIWFYDSISVVKFDKVHLNFNRSVSLFAFLSNPQWAFPVFATAIKASVLGHFQSKERKRLTVQRVQSSFKRNLTPHRNRIEKWITKLALKSNGAFFSSPKFSKGKRKKMFQTLSWSR